MQKVALLAINAKYVHSSLSVWALAAGVSRYARLPHTVEVVEATISQDVGDIAARAAAPAPGVVGVSAYIWNAPMLPGLLGALRALLPGAVFVLGGPEAAHNRDYWLARGADYVLDGDGERAFPALLDRLSGLEPAGPDELDGDWPDPYTGACLDALGGRIAYIETSRGCPFRCAFCLSAGTSVRYLSLDSAKERIAKLARSGARTVKFVDRTFNGDAGRAYALFAYVIGLDTPCCFHFEAAPDLFDARTLSLLATAPPGRIQLEAGLQSFYPPALQASSRRTDLAKAERNIRTILRGKNIHLHLDLIAGLPEETLPHFMDSFDRAYNLGAHHLQLGFLKLLHGSALRARAESLGLRYGAEPPYEITASPWLSAEDIVTLKQAENALRHTNNKGRFLSALAYCLAASGLRPFALFRRLGGAAPNHGTPLDIYARQIYDCLANLPGVDGDALLDCMARDWLQTVRGRKNVPPFLRRAAGGVSQYASGIPR